MSVLAPAGWGFHPGALLSTEPATADQLPDLPFLRFTPPEKRKAVIAQALSQVPALPKITTAMVRARYGIGNMLAGDVLDLARMMEKKRA